MHTRIQEHHYQTEKGPGYFRVYEKKFASLKNLPMTLLELGVAKGGSLELWRDYFPNATIVGLDLNASAVEGSTGRIRCYQGDQQDISLLDRIRDECAPQGFDIIIDDASHLAEPSRISFWHLLEHHLKPQGIYVIEDWGTGYWDFWPDGKAYEGKNHMAGMVGFVKELVDEVGSVDHIAKNDPTHMAKPSRISSVEIRHGMVFVRKAEVADVTME